MSTLQSFVVFIVILSVLKILYMLLNKDGMNRFIKSYYSSMYNKPWLYHNIYIACAIGTLCLVRKSGMGYVEILSAMMVIGFLINAAFTAYPREMFENITLDNINWKRISAYMIIMLYVMAQAIREIFFIN